MTLLYGKPIADRIKARLKQHSLPFSPTLAICLVGDDPASHTYVRAKNAAAKSVNFTSHMEALPADTKAETLLQTIHTLNNDPCVHGILLQLPLPPHLHTPTMLAAVAPHKDVDGLHPLNAGTLAVNSEPWFIPCTPRAILALATCALHDLTGLHAVIVGSSALIGRPLANLLLRTHATVTLAHAASTRLDELCRSADLLITATGKARLIRGDWIKPQAVVLDAGYARFNNKPCGDVCTEEALPHVRAISPVPGGVGPLTVAMLLDNTLTAASRLHAADAPASSNATPATG